MQPWVAQRTHVLGCCWTEEMLFYKFQRPDNLAFGLLRRGEIYFASADELNDASECRPRFVFKGSVELWQRLADYILFNACLSSDYFQPDRWEPLEPILSLSNSIGACIKRETRNQDLGLENLEKLFLKVLEQHLPVECEGGARSFILNLVRQFFDKQFFGDLNEHKYIASFSQNATNATMWGHYADAERGFVIVYESDDETIHVQSPIKVLEGERPSREWEGAFELGIYKEEHLPLQEVQYGRRPPKVNAFHRLIPKFRYSEREDHYDVPLSLGDEAEGKKEDLVGLVKYSDWRYEREVRVFFPTCEAVFSDARILQVGLSNLKGVIFGPRMTSEHKARVIVCCHLLTESRRLNSEPLNEFQFFQARQTVDRFDFQIVPVGIQANLCYGKIVPITPMRSLDSDTAERIQNVAITIAASRDVGRHPRIGQGRCEDGRGVAELELEKQGDVEGSSTDKSSAT